MECGRVYQPKIQNVFSVISKSKTIQVYSLGFSELRLEVGVYSQTKMMLSRNKTLDQARTKGTAGKLMMVAREVSKRQF